MDNLYLVLHEYSSTEPVIYVVKEKLLPEFTKEVNYRKTTVFLYDIEKLKNSLQEVEVVTQIKPIIKNNENT